MDFQKLTYIVAVAEEGSILKASEILYVSQPALSQGIRKAEAEIGHQLFQRERLGLTLTPAGRIYYEFAKSVLSLKAETDRLLNDGNKQLIVGASPTWSNILIPEILPSFANEFPECQVLMEIAASKVLEEQLLESKIDVALIPYLKTREIPEELCAEKLYDEHILVAVPSDNPVCQKGLHVEGAAYPYLDPVHLKRQKFILSTPGHRIYDTCQPFFLENDIVPDVSVYENTVSTVKKLVSTGMGIGFVMESAAEATPSITYFKTDESLMDWVLYLVYKKTSRNSRILEFIDCAQKKLVSRN